MCDVELNGVFVKSFSSIMDIFLQFYDLEELFRTGGNIPDTSYVFLVTSFLCYPLDFIFSQFLLG